MRLGFKALLVMLGFVLLCVPAAVAKNGGNGHGKPSWAAQGKGHEKAAKPAKAKHEKKAKPEKAAHEKKAKKEKKHQQAGSEGEDESAEEGELGLEDLNPSWYCKTLEAMMDAADAEAADGGAEHGEFSSFDAEFGANDNKRNSHGKCVSRRAHGEDLSGALDGEVGSAEEDSAGEEGSAEDEDDGEDEDDQAGEDENEAEDGDLAAFARALVSFIRL